MAYTKEITKLVPCYVIKKTCPKCNTIYIESNCPKCTKKKK